MFIPVGTEEYTPRQRFPVVTVTLVVINSLVFLLELFLLLSGGEQALNAFIAIFGLKPAALTSGVSLLIPSILTLFTSIFVHGSLTHVGFNMLYLLAFGDNVEDWLGWWRYLVFYLLAGLLAGLVHVVSNPVSQIPTVGASGAIAGVLGAYLLIPIADLHHAAEGQALLRISSLEAASYPDFDPTCYVIPGKDWQPPYRPSEVLLEHA